MKVENLRQRIEELPRNLIVTEVNIKTINKHGEELTIEYSKSCDEIKLFKKSIKTSFGDFKFWRRKSINLKK